MPYNAEFTDLARRRVQERVAVAQAMLADRAFMKTLEEVALENARALAAGGKLLLFGNGGSAADAQHIAAELVGRFKRERKGLPAIALTVNTSTLTAIANDYDFESVFARQVEALGSPGDLAIALSTTGNSPNVLRGIEAANSAGLITIGLTGRTGGGLRSRVRYGLHVPSDNAPCVQEAHMLVGHLLCEYVEESIFGRRADQSA